MHESDLVLPAPVTHIGSNEEYHQGLKREVDQAALHITSVLKTEVYCIQDLEEVQWQEQQGYYLLLHYLTTWFKFSVVDENQIVFVNIVLEKEVESEKETDWW